MNSERMETLFRDFDDYICWVESCKTAKIVEEQAFRDRSFVFSDRLQAGKLWGRNSENTLVVKVSLFWLFPAGGVPVAYAVAKELLAPMDVLVVRKIQIPWNTEAGFGALTSDGKIVINEDLVTQLDLTEDEIQDVNFEYQGKLASEASKVQRR